MSGNKGGQVVAGNTRQGRLIATGTHSWEGERLVAGGKFETRKWEGGTRAQVRQEWLDWRAEGLAGATLHVDKVQARQAARATAAGMVKEDKVEEVKETTRAAETDDKAAGEPGKACAYVLVYQAGPRTRRNVAVLDTFDAAAQMADALGVALEAQGMKGAYDVDELPVWGR